MATVSKKKARREPPRSALRELRSTNGAYSATIIREGRGNERDRNWYTRDALEDAAAIEHDVAYRNLERDRAIWELP